MKTFKVTGAIFCVFGFFFALIGILCFVFPVIENDHIKMILNSFHEVSTDTLTNTLNMIVLFSLKNSYFLIFCGISLMVAGGLISSTVHKKQDSIEDSSSVYQVIQDAPATSDTPGIPNPAYYPGGYEPTLQNAEPIDVASIKIQPLKDPLENDSGLLKIKRPHLPVDELLPTSDEADAQKLMHYDEQIKSSDDYAQYRSNTIQDDAMEEAQETKAASNEGTAVQPTKPRIVSTMGKRRF